MRKYYVTILVVVMCWLAVMFALLAIKDRDSIKEWKEDVRAAEILAIHAKMGGVTALAHAAVYSHAAPKGEGVAIMYLFGGFSSEDSALLSSFVAAREFGKNAAKLKHLDNTELFVVMVVPMGENIPMQRYAYSRETCISVSRYESEDFSLIINALADKYMLLDGDSPGIRSFPGGKKRMLLLWEKYVKATDPGRK